MTNKKITEHSLGEQKLRKMGRVRDWGMRRKRRKWGSGRKDSFILKWFFTTIAANLVLWLVNLSLPLSLSISRKAFFSSRSEKNIFFDVDIVVKNKSIVVYRGLYSYRQRYASSPGSKLVVDWPGIAEWVHSILNTVMTRIVVDKSTDHVKLHSIWYLKMVKQDTHRLNLVLRLPCHARKLKNPQAIEEES